MSIRVSNLRLPLDAPEGVLPQHVARVLGDPAVTACPWRILRKSLDARDKDRLQFVYNVEVRVPADEDRLVARARHSPEHPEARVEHYAEPPFVMPDPGGRALTHRPVVIGSGPGGLAAAYFL